MLILVHCDVSEPFPQRHGFALTLLQLSEEFSGCLPHDLVLVRLLVHSDIDLKETQNVQQRLNPALNPFRAFQKKMRIQSAVSGVNQCFNSQTFIHSNCQIGLNKLLSILADVLLDSLQKDAVADFFLTSLHTQTG